jgi:glycosyltransferase involved in cell wall biosynthesis
MLARAGWEVRVVATTASESYQVIDHRLLLRDMGIEFDTSGAASPERTVLTFSHRGVDYRLLDTGAANIDEARRTRTDDLDSLVREEWKEDPPGILLTYGSSESEVRRRAEAQRRGSKVVFSVRNLAYLHPRAFEAVDAIIGASRYVSDYYRQHQGVEVKALPLPISVDDVVAPFTSPTFVTLINPSPQKGVLFFLRIVQKSLERWPDLPFLVVESRGSAGMLSSAAGLLGIDLRSLKNLHIARNTPHPSAIYGVTQILLMPSLIEPAGRAVVEAQLNRIPVVASNRGGLPETVGSGGHILRVIADVTQAKEYPEVEAWLDMLERLRDPGFYAQSSAAAYDATAPYRSGEVERGRVAYFHSVLEGASQGIAPAVSTSAISQA